MSARLQVLLPAQEMDDIRHAARLSYPTADIKQMLSESDQGKQ